MLVFLELAEENTLSKEKVSCNIAHYGYYVTHVEGPQSFAVSLSSFHPTPLFHFLFCIIDTDPFADAT